MQGCSENGIGWSMVKRVSLRMGGTRLEVRYRERFAQEALMHNSNAVHHAFAKHAQVRLHRSRDTENSP